LPDPFLPVVGRHYPGALPGLLDGDTSGVRNKNILQPWEMDFQYNPVTPVLPGGDNGNKVNQPGGLDFQ